MFEQMRRVRQKVIRRHCAEWAVGCEQSAIHFRAGSNRDLYNFSAEMSKPHLHTTLSSLQPDDEVIMLVLQQPLVEKNFLVYYVIHTLQQNFLKLHQLENQQI